MKLNDWEYLGDGVYFMFDGYHIWLHTGSHDRPDNRVALDPDVRAALARRIEAVNEMENDVRQRNNK